MIGLRSVKVMVVIGVIVIACWGCSDDDDTVCPTCPDPPSEPFTAVGGIGSGTSVNLAWGDYDGDGDPDLAVGNRAQNYLYTNDGTGQFAEAAAFGSGNRSLVKWADTDGDNDLDLLVGNDGPNQLFVNQGAGNFNEAPLPDAGETLGIECGDIDGDTDLDILMFTDTGGHRLYLNEGGNTFTADTLIDHQGYSALADVDGDLDLDIVLGGVTGKVLKNDGNGFFTEFSTFGDSNNRAQPVFADYDKDGDLDFVQGVEDGGGSIPPLWLYENDGDGNFTEEDVLAIGNLFMTPQWGDMDADGDPDLVLVSFGWLDDRVVVYTNNGGVFSKLVVEAGETTIAMPVENCASSVALADVDDDGDLDFAVSRTRWVSEFVFEAADNTLFINGLTE